MLKAKINRPHDTGEPPINNAALDIVQVRFVKDEDGVKQIAIEVEVYHSKTNKDAGKKPIHSLKHGVVIDDQAAIATIMQPLLAAGYEALAAKHGVPNTQILI